VRFLVFRHKQDTDRSLSNPPKITGLYEPYLGI